MSAHPKNRAHNSSSFNTLGVVSTSNDLFHWKQPNQSITNPVKIQNYNVPPTVNPPASFLQSNNSYVDFKIPKIDECESTEIRLTVVNNSPDTNIGFTASALNWFDIIEIREGSEIIQTITSDEIYLNNTMYHTTDESARLQTQLFMNTVYEVANANTLAPGATKSVSIPVRSVLNCGLPLAKVKENLTIRVHSKSAQHFTDSNLASYTNLGLNEIALWVREVKYNKPMNHRGALDARYLSYETEQAVLTVSAGSTTKYITNNFDEDETSHVVVLVRPNAPTGADLERFNDINNLYFESENGNNLHNGIQFDDNQLKLDFVDKFPNTMVYHPNKNVYVLNNSMNPVDDHFTGSQNGKTTLKRNFKVCINPSASGTVQVDVFARVYKHVRITPAGKLTIQ